MRSLFGFCCRMRQLPANPAAELTLPAYEKRLAERIVGEADVGRLLEADAQPRDRVLLRLLYTAACAFRKLADYAGVICARAEMLARSQSSAKTAGRGPSPCLPRCGRN